MTSTPTFEAVGPAEDAACTGPTVVLDARWWDVGGTGTLTRSLVRGLATLDPPGRWTLWGSPSLAAQAWPSAAVADSHGHPARWFGQAEVGRVPTGDVVVHPHQVRPWHRAPATASVVLDLIQLRHRPRSTRPLMAARLAATVRAADAVMTISEVVRDELVDRYGIDRSAVTVLRLPVDGRAAEEIARRREAHRTESPPANRVLVAVGGTGTHKNHARLVGAFARTRFAADGGELHLVGGSPPIDAADLPAGVRLRGALSSSALSELMVSATALVQPSLEEGYGLPVAEALAAGVPVCSSPIPAAVEDGPEGLPTFDPTSESAIADAIDSTVDLVAFDEYWKRVDRAGWLARRPTDVDLARQVSGVVGGLAERLR